MKRRHVLTAGAATLSASLAGCAGAVQPQSDLDWSGDYYVADGVDADYALFFLGTVTNTGGNHITQLELTISLTDENDQEITTRSKTLSKIRAGTTQEFHFRVALSGGEAADLDEVAIQPEILAANYAPLASSKDERS